jgi:hypothetical protein
MEPVIASGKLGIFDQPTRGSFQIRRSEEAVTARQGSI